MDRFQAGVRATHFQQRLFQRTNHLQEFEVFWQNLSYSPIVIGWMSSKRIMILNALDGYFKSGELVAVMGPSGAGKSTLLEIIAGRRINGVNGNVKIRGIDEIKVGFVPQDNCLMQSLTVKETFVFASKLLNTESIDFYHNIIADKLIARFGLQACAHTYTHRCSGGQQKRISIALEVLSSPNLLILDEPTTGLDSHSCSHVMNILQQLVSNQTNPMAIVVTIHQPSVPIFNRFNRVYTLTRNGKCLYNGTPTKLIQTLMKVGLICDSYTSPADFIIEIASGDYGPDAIKRLCDESKKLFDNINHNLNTKILAKATKHVSHPFGEHLKILLNRSQLMLFRNPFLTYLRIIAIIFSAVFNSLLFGSEASQTSGCVPRLLEVYGSPVKELGYRVQNDLRMVLQNVALLFFGILLLFFVSVSTSVLAFAYEMNTFRKEYNNGWYSCLTYYLAKSLSDLPLQIIGPVVYITIMYTLSEQPLELFRFVGLIITSILLSLLAQSFGELLSAVWMDRPFVGVFIGEMSPMPMIYVSGLMVQISRMPLYLRPVSWLSLMRFAIEANVVMIYGFNRCDYNYNQFLSKVNVSALTKPDWYTALQAMQSFYVNDDQDESIELTEVQKDEQTMMHLYSIFVSKQLNGNKELSFNTSLFMGFMELTETNLYYSFALLIAYIIALKICTYFVLQFKLKQRK